LRKKESIEKPREVLPAGTRDSDFFSKVYEVVRLVPRGRVTTYGAIARFLGSGKSARMVGWAMNACHQVTPPVPAHRVVNRNGQLSGKMHFGEPGRMEKLLNQEKIKVSKDTIVNFEQLLWDPQKEIEML
jgi:methylated-DNA-protein-cysteine methyltransferase-like protein